MSAERRKDIRGRRSMPSCIHRFAALRFSRLGKQAHRVPPGVTVAAGPEEAQGEVAGAGRSAACPRRKTYPGSAESGLRRISSSSARNTAAIGPAPPKATRVKSRGSTPSLTVMVRMASAMAALEIARMPSAKADRLHARAAGPATRSPHFRSTRHRVTSRH